MTIEENELEIIEEFSMFDDWMDKYEFIIEIGKELSVFEDKFKVEDNLIKGCQSRVWVQADFKNDIIQLSADSDAIITKGIIALLIRVLNNQKPEDILQAKLTFIKEIGLQEHLSPTRANGLLGMVKQIKTYALAYMAKS
ncbi:MAG: SufE family protein [Flavobacteriales bacterium]|jgi:cysteine desulfuration protein SufE|nr:SufE family protein [Flavobacteriales bacterium]|tara:strand:- start:197 stop:616 length:420 start_codon:yes stop_codon:yes gene_type:complete